MMSIADWPETRRRMFGLSVALLFVGMGFFIGAGNIAETPAAERAGLWTLFSVTAVGAATLMGWYSWRKLTRPDFDTGLDVRGAKMLVPLVALGFLITRLLPEEGAAPIVGGAVTAGFFGGILLVYGYDALTNRLSEGRSWRRSVDGGHSKTSSPN